MTRRCYRWRVLHEGRHQRRGRARHDPVALETQAIELHSKVPESPSSQYREVGKYAHVRDIGGREHRTHALKVPSRSPSAIRCVRKEMICPLGLKARNGIRIAAVCGY